MEQNITAAYRAERNGVVCDFEHRGDLVSMRGADGTFSAWDMDHWRKVKSAREGRISVGRINDGVSHPLAGKRLLDTSSGKQYIVEKVKKSWHFGSFLMAVMRIEGTESHAMFFIENISSVMPSTLEKIEEFQANFRVVE